jgi:hypothetical protein
MKQGWVEEDYPEETVRGGNKEESTRKPNRPSGFISGRFRRG